ncbi:hypothetical protein OH77DRAFT_104492 [Trametes cingulata]|nr:hypothetical protein OH77DRAFT_104492 [Trametes cingulata]
MSRSRIAPPAGETVKPMNAIIVHEHLLQGDLRQANFSKLLKSDQEMAFRDCGAKQGKYPYIPIIAEASGDAITTRLLRKGIKAFSSKQIPTIGFTFHPSARCSLLPSCIIESTNTGSRCDLRQAAAKFCAAARAHHACGGLLDHERLRLRHNRAAPPSRLPSGEIRRDSRLGDVSRLEEV